MQKSPDDFPEGDFRRFTARYSYENFPNILALIQDLKAVGDKQGATPGQVALAWLLAQGDDIIPIPGTRQVKVSALVTHEHVVFLRVNDQFPP